MSIDNFTLIVQESCDSQDIHYFFDEIAAMYDIAECNKELNVICNKVESDNLSFDFTSNSIETINNFKLMMNNTNAVHKFREKFLVLTNEIDNGLNIKLQKLPS